MDRGAPSLRECGFPELQLGNMEFRVMQNGHRKDHDVWRHDRSVD